MQKSNEQTLNKILIMSEKKEHLFNKVRVVEFRGAAHWDCNINFQLTKKVPLIFDNLRGYDSHLIFNELDKFDVKISVIPNGLEKYMVPFLNKNFVFIDSVCNL